MTLDADTEALLRRLMRERGISFKEALNQAVRLGASGPPRAKASRFQQRTFKMGFRPEFRWDKSLALAESMEDEELVRKLQTRK